MYFKVNYIIQYKQNGQFAKLYLPKVSPAQHSDQSKVLEGQRTFPLLTGETGTHSQQERL